MFIRELRLSILKWQKWVRLVLHKDSVSLIQYCVNICDLIYRYDLRHLESFTSHWHHLYLSLSRWTDWISSKQSKLWIENFWPNLTLYLHTKSSYRIWKSVRVLIGIIWLYLSSRDNPSMHLRFEGLSIEFVDINRSRCWSWIGSPKMLCLLIIQVSK